MKHVDVGYGVSCQVDWSKMGDSRPVYARDGLRCGNLLLHRRRGKSLHRLMADLSPVTGRAADRNRLEAPIRMPARVGSRRAPESSS